MPVAATPSRITPNRSSLDDRKQRTERQRRAQEWKQFRKDYLFTQNALACTLECARRTIVAIEGAESDPHYDLQRRFRDLKRDQEQKQKRYESEVA